ncbi:hypothetical protein TWF506_007064 [Arthrobotrys conoides]|uniref:NOT2/NOT3/NOT5 C-terminal domain-containing protein n=1 Tax=Arthrobotrys conoides TaxID=74498 RepID=A0AAN8NN23_9PEZI
MPPNGKLGSKPITPSNHPITRLTFGYSARKASTGWAFPPTQQAQNSSIAAFGQPLANSSQPATPFDISEFPVLGTGSAHQNSNQGWGRANTQSPSQVQGRPAQDELYQNSHLIDDFSIQRVGGQIQGSGGPSSRNPRLGSNEDFPALPSSSALVGDGLNERKGSFLLGSQTLQGLDMLSQSDTQRQAFLNGGLSSSGLQTGSGRQQHQQGAGGGRNQNLNASQQQQQAMRLSPIMMDHHQTHHPSLSHQQPQTSSSSTAAELSPDSNRKTKTASSPGSIAPPTGTVTATTVTLNSMPQSANGRLLAQQPSNSSSITGILSQSDPQSDQQPQRYSSTPPDTEPSESSGPSEIDRFGLNGLLPLIRNEDLDMALLALGTDLTQLGLELNQPEYGSIFLNTADHLKQPLSATFASPWSDQQVRAAEPDFKLPQCYAVLNTQPLQSKVRNFSDETLFYIFYTMPKDVMQEIVAQELTQRNWRYHKELQVWLTKVPGNEPSQIVQGRFEKGVYVFFEPTLWERQQKEFILEYAALDQSRMSLS